MLSMNEEEDESANYGMRLNIYLQLFESPNFQFNTGPAHIEKREKWLLFI